MVEKLPERPDKFTEELFKGHKENLIKLREILMGGSSILQAYEKIMKDENFQRTMDSYDLWKAFDEHPDVKLYQQLMFTENEIEVPEEKKEN